MSKKVTITREEVRSGSFDFGHSDTRGGSSETGRIVRSVVKSSSSSSSLAEINARIAGTRVKK